MNPLSNSWIKRYNLPTLQQPLSLDTCNAWIDKVLKKKDHKIVLVFAKIILQKQWWQNPQYVIILQKLFSHLNGKGALSANRVWQDSQFCYALFHKFLLKNTSTSEPKSIEPLHRTTPIEPEIEILSAQMNSLQLHADHNPLHSCLPLEILLHIVSLLNIADLSLFSRTAKIFYNILPQVIRKDQILLTEYIGRALSKGCLPVAITRLTEKFDDRIHTSYDFSLKENRINPFDLVSILLAMPHIRNLEMSIFSLLYSVDSRDDEKINLFDLVLPLISTIDCLIFELNKEKLTYESLRSFLLLDTLKKIEIKTPLLSSWLLKKILDACPNLKTLILENCNFISPFATKQLQMLTHLQSIKLINCPLPDTCFRNIIKECPKLKKLSIVRCTGPSVSVLELIGSLSRLEKLKLHKTTLNDEAFRKIICECRHLKSISLKECSKLSSKGLSEICRLKSVTTLELAKTNITPSIMHSIAQTHKRTLTSLTLDQNDLLDAHFFSTFPQFDSLRRLCLMFEKHITDTTLSLVLTKCLSLTTLHIASEKGLTYQGWKKVSILTHLKELYIADSWLSFQEIFSIVRNCSSLKKLIILSKNADIRLKRYRLEALVNEVILK
jgi:hypothetical protein